MDITANSTAGRLISELANDSETAPNKIASFPASSEEYLNMEIEERLGVAGEVLAVYANLPTYDSRYEPDYGTPARIYTDNEGVILEGRVGYCNLSPSSGPAEPELLVWLRAVNPITGSQTKFKTMTSLTLPDKDGKWRLWYQTPRPGYAESIEVIDEAVSQLIDGKITQQRLAIGKSALTNVSDNDLYLAA